MKRVLIITRHAIANYGSLLQAIALEKKVEELGYDTKVIDFIRDDESIGKSVITEGKLKSKWNKNFITLVLYCLIKMPISILADTRFKRMRKRYLKMTKKYTSCIELTQNKPIADIYMTGSDQVWGPIISGEYEWAYFLKFCSDSDKKISYAASFGKKELSENAEKTAMQFINRYDSITVREDSAVELLNRNGINSQQVIDPTLLLSAKEWEELLNVPERKIKEKYILIYQIHNNKELDKYAMEFAKRAKLQLIRVSPLLHQCIRGGKFKFAPDLGEFISYIKNAEYLITDSFHGTVFSINFNIPLVTLMPNTGTSTRNASILKLTNLLDRIVTDISDFSIIERKVDFTYANKVLDEERKSSMQILRQELQENE